MSGGFGKISWGVFSVLSIEIVKRIKGLLLTVGILSFSAIVLIFAAHRKHTPSGQADMAVSAGATIGVNGFHRRATIREGTKDWSLDADSAALLLEENKVVLKGLRYTFFSPDGNNVLLKADSGVWKTDSNDLEVTGNVMLESNQYVFQTETLSYNDTKRKIISRMPVSVESAALTGKADAMEYHLDTGLIYLPAVGNKGNIGKKVDS